MTVTKCLPITFRVKFTVISQPLVYLYIMMFPAAIFLLLLLKSNIPSTNTVKFTHSRVKKICFVQNTVF